MATFYGCFIFKLKHNFFKLKIFMLTLKKIFKKFYKTDFLKILLKNFINYKILH